MDTEDVTVQIAKVQVFALSLAVIIAITVTIVTGHIFPLVITGSVMFTIVMVCIFIKYIIEPGVLPLGRTYADQGHEYGTFSPSQNNAFEDSLPDYERATQHLVRPADQYFATDAAVSALASSALHKSLPLSDPPSYEDATRNYLV